MLPNTGHAWLITNTGTLHSSVHRAWSLQLLIVSLCITLAISHTQVYMDGRQMGGALSPGQSAVGVVPPGPPTMSGVPPGQPPMGVASPGHSGVGVVSPGYSPMGVVSPGQSVTLNPVLRQHSYDTMFQAPYQAPSMFPQQQAPPPGHNYSYFHGAPPTNHTYTHQGQIPSVNPYEAGQFGGTQARPSAPPKQLQTSYSVGKQSHRTSTL